ncbi:Y4bD/Y4pK family protein [Polaromonas sp. P1-6]|nr:Y4bD/Y4pK family protein [Polaromonas sp. P1-6]
MRAGAPIEFEITHTFHPWRGKRFVLTTRKQNWGEDRVTFFDEDGRLRSVLASWTNVDEPDAFARAAGSRSWLRTDDLVRLRALVDEVRIALQQRKGVKKTTPHK